jgi:hypothetical protein
MIKEAYQTMQTPFSIILNDSVDSIFKSLGM